MAMMTMMAISMAKSINTEQNMPSASTEIVLPVAREMSQGIGSLRRAEVRIFAESLQYVLV